MYTSPPLSMMRWKNHGQRLRRIFRRCGAEVVTAADRARSRVEFDRRTLNTTCLFSLASVYKTDTLTAEVPPCSGGDAKTRTHRGTPLAQLRSFSRFRPIYSIPLLALSLIALPARAQTEDAQPSAVQTVLPDSPGSLIASSANVSGADWQNNPDPNAVNPTTKPIAPRYRMTIGPDEQAQRLTRGQTSILGLRGAASPFALTGSLFAAGWSHLWNTTPNYGTNSTAFGQRFGAALVSGASKGIFSNAVFAPLFHQDPRYYRMGRDNGNFGSRLWYAGTRVFVTRTMDGHPAPNLSLFAGAAGSSALTVTYYPARDTNIGQVAKTFGFSLAGSCVGRLTAEFLPDALAIVHRGKHE